MGYTIEIIGNVSDLGKGIPAVHLVLTREDTVFTMDTQTRRDKVYVRLANVRLYDVVVSFCKRFGVEKENQVLVLDLDRIDGDEFTRKFLVLVIHVYLTSVFDKKKRQQQQQQQPGGSSVDEAALPVVDTASGGAVAAESRARSPFTHTIEMRGRLSEAGKSLPVVKLVVEHDGLSFTVDTQSRAGEVFVQLADVELNEPTLIFCRTFAEERANGVLAIDVDKIDCDEFARQLLCLVIQMYATGVLEPDVGAAAVGSGGDVSSETTASLPEAHGTPVRIEPRERKP